MEAPAACGTSLEEPGAELPDLVGLAGQERVYMSWSTSEAGMCGQQQNTFASGIWNHLHHNDTNNDSHTLSFNYQGSNKRQTTTMTDRKNLHIGVFIPAPLGAQLLDTACIDVFGVASYEYLSALSIVPKEISSLAPEVKISYIGSQKSGENYGCLGLLSTISASPVHNNTSTFNTPPMFLSNPFLLVYCSQCSA